MKNRALLVTISGYSNKLLESFDELEQLCLTLDFYIVDKIYQKKLKPDPNYYFGKGKLEKIKSFCYSNNINFLVINDNITSLQRKNIEKFLKIKVLDRTEIILEIFSKHAKTKEGKIQVEIAKLQYLLPYLVGYGKELSRLGGGIGTRGPGERQLEYSRRHIKNRIRSLKRQLENIKHIRELQRKKRLKSSITKISVIGYTNAGKSTLLSKLSGENLVAKNEMFTTLSPFTRKVKLPSNRIAIFSDTVGFISNLHPKIIEAFHSTLEEINYSDILLILVDSSDNNYEKKLETVFETLEKIGIYNKPYILVFNKIDLITSELLETIKNKYPYAIYISAKNNLNLNKLLLKIDEVIDKISKKVITTIKTNKMNILFKYSEQIKYNVLDSNSENIKIELYAPEKMIEKIIKEVNE
ncbi:MAG: GTPase HflX [Thermosipho sp. (in: Bacteria)]|nr:GTPase HflX [Thermosipho sp. (in: thermotogales)]